MMTIGQNNMGKENVVSTQEVRLPESEPDGYCLYSEDKWREIELRDGKVALIVGSGVYSKQYPGRGSCWLAWDGERYLTVLKPELGQGDGDDDI